MGYTFEVELDTAQPFIVDLEVEEYNTQVLSGNIILHLEKPESFKIATVAVTGHVGVMLNIGTPDAGVVHERLVNTTSDLVAANDTNGNGLIDFDAGTQYLPFRIDIPRSGDLPPTLLNKLDTPYIDWKYEIQVTLRRGSLFSTTKVFKHDLTLRRLHTPSPSTKTLTSSTDVHGRYRSKLTADGVISLGQDMLQASVELKARHKEYMIKEIDCAIVQTEDINFKTKRGHPSVDNAHVPGAPCKINASRLVSNFKKVRNEENSLDFGRKKPIEMDLRIDNFQLIPTEHMLDWLQISHVLRYTIHFMDVQLEPIVTELPLFVGHEDLSSAAEPMLTFKRAETILMPMPQIESHL
ncbi:hypothetical protein BGZ81_011411 [Podila clonocystis]|nr:hypothetical protein BGZ81_011411 [Podila clonocystis]